MYKIIVLTTSILGWTTFMHSISLDQNMLKNSSTHYLIDLAHFINDTNITKQVGQELFLRNYSSLAATYDSQVGHFNAKPNSPGDGYSADQGQWVWVASSYESETGTWWWILKTVSEYILLFTPTEPG